MAETPTLWGVRDQGEHNDVFAAQSNTLLS